MRTYIFMIFCLWMFFSSCTSDEIGSISDVNTDAIYFDYMVNAEEDREYVTINLQYRMGGPNGTTLVLNEGSNVKLDGEELIVDSAKFYGAYYETQKPLNSFSGKHSILFTDINKKEYLEEFEFSPFTINPDVPESLSRGDLVFNLNGLDPLAFIRVNLIDTSFESDDINRIDTVKNGQLIISKERMEKLTNGPIFMQLEKTSERAVNNGTKEGGKLLITYSLKRHFELKTSGK